MLVLITLSIVPLISYLALRLIEPRTINLRKNDSSSNKIDHRI
jgi:hypothetical protein